ncbi:DUF2963 domain-containing protein, partial [Candidatus Phytoplasma prunorum]
TQYQADGKIIKVIYEYNKDTGKLIKKINYSPKGESIANIIEYDKDSGQKITKDELQQLFKKKEFN